MAKAGKKSSRNAGPSEAVNPFEYGRELEPYELADRVEVVAKVRDAMLQGRKLFLIGPRRFGKTSVIRSAELDAIAKNAIVLRYDASAFPTLSELALRLASDATAVFAGTVVGAADRMLKAAKDMFERLQPSITIGPDGSTRLTLGVDFTHNAAATAVPLLSDVLDGVERGAKKIDRPVAVVLDEFQDVVERGGVEAESQIRAAVQRHKRVGYVFAGSKTRLMIDMTSPGRPFYNLGDREFIGPVPRPDFARTLAAGFARGAIAVEDGALDTIMNLAEDVPFTVQLLARACWDTCRAGVPVGTQPASLTVDVITRVHARVVREQDPYFSGAWESLTPAQRTALVALVQNGGVRLASSAVARQFRTSVSTLQSAIDALQARGIIRDDTSNGATRLRVDDPLFGAWISLFVGKAATSE
jgi:uncharacterized protein